MVKMKLVRASMLLAVPFCMVTTVTTKAAVHVATAATKDVVDGLKDYNTLLQADNLLKVMEDPMNCQAAVEAMDTIFQYEYIEEFKFEETVNAESPYEDLAISVADSYLNIRKEHNESSEIIGKLYEGSAAKVLEVNGDWAKISSSGIVGYVHTSYLAIGEQAETLFDKYAMRVATVTTQTLKVREKEDVNSTCITLIPQGGEYEVMGETDRWVKIQLENTSGYVDKEFVKIGYQFEYAVSIEEEQARMEEESEASRKEQQSSNAVKKPSTSTVSKPSTNSSLGNKIANYALQFVGNPYVWGGTSLTNGADCSGFVQSVYKKFGYSIPRTSRSQATAGTKVSASNLQAGDLIFYAKNGTINHVALYIGGGKVVHASSPKSGIKTSKYNYRNIVTIRRIIK